MREIKFRAWSDNTKCYYKDTGITSLGLNDGIKKALEIGYILEQYTGLKDKNGIEGYFNSDIWEVERFKYDVWNKRRTRFTTKSICLQFILTNYNPLEVGYIIINKPDDLKGISLNVIFNLPNENGNRIFIDDYRTQLEIIGNIRE